MTPPQRCPGPISRRRFLQLGALSVGLGAIRPYQIGAAESQREPATSVILIWLPGGPPHMETYDMKPGAPVEYRGAFRPIKTTVPGIDVCEHMPLHAKTARRFSLIRSVHHNFSDHGGGHKKFLTGRDPLSPVGFINDYPMVGSMVAKLRHGTGKGVPEYISGTDGGRDGIDVYSFGSAYLSSATHPFSMPGDPSSATFQIRNLVHSPEARARLDKRIGLLGKLDSNVPGLPASAATSGEIRKQALTLMTSNRARVAFDITRESQPLRDRYGMHAWGQRALMARRLVEAGASFVTMVMENPYQSGVPYLKDGTYNWDSHAVNCHIFNDTKARLPFYDRAVTALIDDLYDRGLDKRVLLIVTGEFGRTPRITYAEGRPGRDHWPSAMSILVSGGGLKMGQVVGSTDSKGERPKDRPLSVNDLWATMFRHLDIDPHQTSFLDHQGRPMPILPEGKPIAELL